MKLDREAICRENVTIVMSPRLLHSLQRAARETYRSRSNMARYILEIWLREQGYFPEDGADEAGPS